MILAPGFHPVPDGHLATVVTHLEMRAPPERRPIPETPLTLGPWPDPDPDAYRALFRAVGADWLWQSRLAIDDAALTAILHDPGTAILRPLRDGTPVGLLELDFRAPRSCELAFFGLVPGAVGSGAGRWLMDRALTIAWDRPIDRLWVHTCTLDHPAALPFYRRTGFAVTRQEVEILPDPRLSGLLPRDAAPHVPLALPAAPS